MNDHIPAHLKIGSNRSKDTKLFLGKGIKEISDGIIGALRDSWIKVFNDNLVFDINRFFGFMSNIISLISDSKLGLNILTGTLISGLGTLLHTDLYYTVAGVYSTMIAQVTDESLYSVYALLFQSVYGIVSIIGPTSLLVIFALKYFDVPYTTWVKYIWRFVLLLLLLLILVLLVLSLI